MKVYLETYGCAKNQADSHIMSARIDESEHELSDYESADVVVINTCIVKSKTENRMRSRLEELSDSNKELIVAGCMPEALMELVKKIVPDASMLGPSSVHKVSSLIDGIDKGEKALYVGGKKPNKASFSKLSVNRLRKIVPISEGCTGVCTFCIIKKARKDLKSYPVENIVHETVGGVFKGVKEFYLCAEDTGCYGFDIGESLPNLMDEIADIEGKFKVRIGMMNPDNALKVLDRLIESYKSDKFYNFLHIPVQSGSNSVLEDMNRRYTIEEFERIVNLFRSEIPNLNVATDIIAGFPTESEEDFHETLDFLERVKPEVVNVSKYGSRPGTVARREFKDNPSEVIKKRSKKVSELVGSILDEKKRSMLGERRRVLITGKDKRGLKARDGSYNQFIVDKGELGDFEEVIVKDYEKFYLISEAAE